MILAIDFDGTIVEHEYPQIGREIPFAVSTLKRLRDDGHILILWTYREGKALEDALDWCKERGLEFHAVNTDDPMAAPGTGPRKINADYYIDDRNVGGLPEWGVIYEMISRRCSYRRYLSDLHHQQHKAQYGGSRRGLWQRLTGKR